MRKEYLKPEAELMKFVEEEEIMAPDGEAGVMSGVNFNNIDPAALY